MRGFVVIDARLAEGLAIASRNWADHCRRELPSPFHPRVRREEVRDFLRRLALHLDSVASTLLEVATEKGGGSANG